MTLELIWFWCLLMGPLVALCALAWWHDRHARVARRLRR